MSYSVGVHSSSNQLWVAIETNAYIFTYPIKQCQVDLIFEDGLVLHLACLGGPNNLATMKKIPVG